MATQAYELERPSVRRPLFSAIRWGAVFGGVVAGVGVYMMLTLLGIAVGITAVEPQAAQPVGSVPMWTGIWSFISMLVGAFVGGWVAGRGSGLRRRMDGMLHGLVAWGLTTLFFAYLATTAAATVVGGTLNVFGQVMQTTAQAAGQVAGGGGAMSQLQQLITGTPGAPEVDPQTLSTLQERLAAQDRNGAINVMVNEMGFARDRATQIVDQVMPLFAGAGQQVEQAAAQATAGLTAASWWLFATLLIGLGLGVWGGATGARATSQRTVGDHAADRHHEERYHERTRE